MFRIGQLSQYFGNWKGKIVFFLSIGLLHTKVGYAQSASATWQSPADTTTTAAVVTGNIIALNQRLSTSGDTSTTLTVKDNVGGTTSGSYVGVAQRLWLNNHFWPNESAQQNGRYIQYSVSPLPKNKFTVTSITFNIGELGSTDKFFANIYYSTDSTFATKIQLNSTALVLSNAAAVSLTTLSYSPAVFVDTGMSFYVRIYPWYNASSTSATKYVLLANVVISGTSSLVGAPLIVLAPTAVSFGTIKVNTTKDNYFTLSGSYLNPASDSIRITAPTGFQVSTTLGKNYSSYLALPYSGSTLNLDTIYVRFIPSIVQMYSDTIRIFAGGITPKTISVSGTAVDPNTILGIFVSTTGSDADSGTYNHPYLTIQKAVSVAKAGDTIFIRAGSYANSTTINLSQSGTASNMIGLYAYPPDNARPFLNFSSMAYSSSNRGVNLAGSYWHIKGLDIYRAGDNGIFTSGLHNIIEFCAFHENRDGGCQIGGGASYNQFINCDSYFNYDSTGDVATAGGNADGFSPKLDVGTGNYFYGCRAWQNSDDGWDGYLRPSDNVNTTIENCWSFLNGYLKDGVTTYSKMNGNGFKMGGSDAKNLRHNMVVKNCLSFLNKSKGFDQNSNLGSMTILNCTAYQNGQGDGKPNFYVSIPLATGKELTVENCIAFGSTGVTLSIPGTIITNSWASPFAGATAADFISLDTTGVRGPRKADGSLPDIAFMHLASTSQFVDAGTDVGLPFLGRAPDLGCFESGYVTGVKDQTIASIPHMFTLYQNYPNPFNPSTTITYQIPYAGTQNFVSLQVYDILGRNVATLVNEVKPAGTYMAVWNASGMSSGMYFIRLSARRETGQLFLQTGKMLLTK